MAPEIAPIRRKAKVDLPIAQVFSLWTDSLVLWWPRAFTWSQEKLERIVIEPHAGGRCFERGPFDFHCDFGRVLVCEPPSLLRFTWQIAPDRTPQPDPEKCSEVEVRLAAASPTSTTVAIEHRGFARHGDGGEAYRQGMEQGWDELVRRLEATAQPL
ncbi:SRPBCC family protein [Vulgatibacter sp.]|uniref:SRPBCC family protein n=1 Tax=Vulgatibacter sp. TaxID=1971226 RepID=UPI0035690DC6